MTLQRAEDSNKGFRQITDKELFLKSFDDFIKGKTETLEANINQIINFIRSIGDEKFEQLLEIHDQNMLI